MKTKIKITISVYQIVLAIILLSVLVMSAHMDEPSIVGNSAVVVAVTLLLWLIIDD